MFKALLVASRPKTLSAALSPLVLSAGLSFRHFGAFHLSSFVFTVLSVFSIQIATNLFNDGLDFKKGADTEHRLGPRRVTASGELSFATVMGLGFLFCFLAILFGIPLILQGGIPVLFVGVLSLFFTYAYTGGPYPLAYKGLGDFFVLLFFGWVACVGSVYLFTGQAFYKILPEALILGTQAGVFSVVLIAINNARDIREDRENQKLTLAARFGIQFARIEIIFMYLIGFGLNFYWIWLGYVGTALGFFALFPAVYVCLGVFKESPSGRYNLFLAKAAKTQILFSLLFLLGILFF